MERFLFVAIFVGIGLGYLFSQMRVSERVRSIRKDAVKRSHSVQVGQISEHLIPLTDQLPFHMKDMVFLGKGVDYIAFSGGHAGHVDEIVFIEIKTGGSRLNVRERQIKDAIEQGKVRYEIVRIED